jgi:hypothetical protein
METRLTPTLTRQKAAAHEALYPELERLTRQLEAMAVKRPGAPVPPATSAIAADLLFDAQRFAGMRRGLPEVAADVGGLATQLGRALAKLDAFEAENSGWNPRLSCFAWSLRDPLPVKRLRQQSDSMKTAREERDSEGIREKLLKRFDERIERAYDEGYEHASAGRPHIGSIPASTSSEKARGRS